MSLARLPMCAHWIDSQYSNYSLLDAGCRTMELKPLLRGCREYRGSDLFPGDGILQCDLEKPLPFDDKSFDIVAVLDVLEHLDNPHATLRELMRVAKKSVFLSLPNIYYITFRMKFARGEPLSGKYIFPPIPVIDRHRWVMSYDEAVEFARGIGKDAVVTPKMILPLRGWAKPFLSPLEKWLAENWPNLFAYGALVQIKLDAPAGAK